MALLITGLPVAQKGRKTGGHIPYKIKRETSDLRFLWRIAWPHMIAFQPKFTKFLKTCYSEKLQYFQGKTSYKGTTKLGRGFGGRVDRNLKGGYLILLFWHIAGGGGGWTGGGNKFKCLVKNWKIGNWQKLKKIAQPISFTSSLKSISTDVGLYWKWTGIFKEFLQKL